MITDNLPTPALRIEKETGDYLLLSNGSRRYRFQRGKATVNGLKALQKRCGLKHEGLLCIYKVENSAVHSEVNSGLCDCGVMMENYGHTLRASVRDGADFSHQQVVQTLKPIKSAIDYLVLQQYDSGPITLDSIVCTSADQIRLKDGYFSERPWIFAQRQDYSRLVYEDLANILHSLLFGNDHKPWKTRYRHAVSTLSQEFLNFYDDLIGKFAPGVLSTNKSKPIHKLKKKVKIINQESSNEGEQKMGRVQLQLGKQNMIVQ